MGDSKPKLVRQVAKNWIAQEKLHGPHAFLKYIIFRFTENVNKVSQDFVFKGGNLLWFYIRTPRATVDLDFSTRSQTNHEQVRLVLENACNVDEEVIFQIVKFKALDAAAKCTIRYKLESGANNQFEVDVVYGLKTTSTEIPSPLSSNLKLHAVTLENVIVDKFSASHQFGSGNTRMKDFDDLWRIVKSVSPIDRKLLEKLSQERKVPLFLALEWIGESMKDSWTVHQKRYKDLPQNLEDLFSEVNAAFE